MSIFKLTSCVEDILYKKSKEFYLFTFPMRNHQQGFILIQIIIAIFASIAVVGGTAFVAYEAGQESSGESPQSTTATTTAETDSESGELEHAPTPPAELNMAATSTSTDATVSQEQGIGYADEEPETAQIETSASTPTSTSINIVATPSITPPATSAAQNLRESALTSISSLLDTYNTTVNWIDNGIMPLFSQRERILDGLILNTQGFMASSSDPVVLYAYGLFIDAYTRDKSQIVDFYRGKFLAIKNRINNESTSLLKAEYEKFSAVSSVSKAEYDALAQLLTQYEGRLQSTYNAAIQATIIEYISLIGSTDGMYQKLWAELSIVVSDPGTTAQNLENIVTQLRLEQPRPLD